MHLNQNVNVRSSGRLNEPMFSSSTSSERCFEYYAPRSYNKLSDDIKSLNSVGSFKSLGTYIHGLFDSMYRYFFHICLHVLYHFMSLFLLIFLLYINRVVLQL